MSYTDKRKTKWIRNLGAVFGGPIVLFFTAIAIIIGIFGDNLVEKYNDRPDAYLISCLIVGGAYLLVVIITLIVVTITFSKERNKEIVEAINKQPQTCKDIQSQFKNIQYAAKHIQSVLSDTEVSKSIISGSAIDDLEASIGKEKRIIIFTSKFALEGTGSFTNVIIRNFRKGVKYEYYVPNDERAALGPYWSRVRDWYRNFSIFTENKQKAESLIRSAEQDSSIGHIWNPQYIELINQYIEACSKTNQNQKSRSIIAIKAKLTEMFTAQLVSYALDVNLFYVTVAMYEKDINIWSPIIKLPTINPQENYVAFSLDNANPSEKASFINNILHLPNTNPPLQIPTSVFLGI